MVFSQQYNEEIELIKFFKNCTKTIFRPGEVFTNLILFFDGLYSFTGFL